MTDDEAAAIAIALDVLRGSRSALAPQDDTLPKSKWKLAARNSILEDVF